jgi:predicted DNA-binding transcriptional regulator AlpA
MFITIKQAAEILQCHPETLYRQIRLGTFPFKIYRFSHKMIRVDLTEHVEIKLDKNKITKKVDLKHGKMKEFIINNLDMSTEELMERTDLTRKQIYNLRFRIRKQQEGQND